MAEKPEATDAEISQAFIDYVNSAAAGKKTDTEWANDKAISKMVKDCIPKYKTFSEASVFPKLMDKTTKKISRDRFVKEFFPCLAKMAVEDKTKEKNLDFSDPRVEKLCKELRCAVRDKCSAPKAAGAKVPDSVARLTDTSKYTGSHKERFDESGKGKGAAGRKEEVNTTGYTGQYKGEGTYDKK